MSTQRRRERERDDHPPYQICPDGLECVRPYCRIFREGYEVGYAEGFAEGLAAGMRAAAAGESS